MNAKTFYNWTAYFSKTFRGIRDFRGLTQSKLAKNVGVALATIRSWERGAIPPVPFLCKLCNELGFHLIITSKGTIFLAGEEANELEELIMKSYKQKIVSIHSGIPLDN